MRLDLEQSARSDAAASRGFANDAESIEERTRVVEGAIATDRAEVREIDAELSCLNKPESNADSGLTTDVLLPRHDTGLKRIEPDERRLELLARQRELVIARKRAWEEMSSVQARPVLPVAGDEEVHPVPLANALRALSERGRQARAEIEVLTVRAPVDGRVGEVLLAPARPALAGTEPAIPPKEGECERESGDGQSVHRAATWTRGGARSAISFSRRRVR